MSKRLLFMLSMEEPIGVIMRALAYKLSIEMKRNPSNAQHFASVYAAFSYAPLLNEILNDVFTQETIVQSLAPRKIDSTRHLMAIGFSRLEAEEVVMSCTRMTIMIVTACIPPAVMRRTNNEWSLVEPYDLWVYTNEPDNEDPTDSGYQEPGADVVLSRGIGQHS